MKKWVYIPLIVLGSVLLLLLLINILAGPIAKRYVEKHSMQLCHRVATVERVRVNIFNGTVNIKNLNVQEEDGKSSFLSLDNLKVNISLAKLLSKTVRLTEINLDGLDTKVVQNGKRFNFSDIIELYTKDKKKKDKDKKSPWSVDLRNIKIANSNIVYEDAVVDSHFGLKNVALEVPRLFFSGGNSDIGLDLHFEEGGQLALKMLYDMSKGDYNMNVKMSKFKISAIEPYLIQSFNIGHLKGLLSGDIKVTGSMEHILNLVATGDLSLNDFSVKNGNGSPLASFKVLKLKVGQVDLQNNDYRIDDVNLKDLVFNYEIFESGNTLSMLKKSKSKTETAADTSSVKKEPLKYLVKKFILSNAQVQYVDHKLRPQQFSYPISHINLTVSNLENGKPADVFLDALLGTTGLLKCSGNVNPMDMSTASLNVSLDNLTLKDFTPYSLHYLAYPVTDGLLTFKSDNVIKGYWLDSKNNLDIYKPEFGSKVKSIKPAAANLPMKAALYLITDRKGHVKMDLPVTGDVSSPEFSFKKIIWKTITNLMVKVVASPVDFIAKLVGENTFKPMEMPAEEQYVLSVENCYQLNDIAKVMAERPNMQLELQVGVNPEVGEGVDSAAVQSRVDVLRQDFASKIRGYLATQQVSQNRVLLDDFNRPKVSEGKVKVVFNLKVED